MRENAQSLENQSYFLQEIPKRKQSLRSPARADSPIADRDFNSSSTASGPSSSSLVSLNSTSNVSPPPQPFQHSLSSISNAPEPLSASALGAAMRAGSPTPSSLPSSWSSTIPAPPARNFHTPNSSTSSSFFLQDRDREPPSASSNRFRQSSPSPTLPPNHRAQRNLSNGQASRALMLSPPLNSSRSSLASVGSSYHSWEEPEIGSLQALYDYEESRKSPKRIDSDPTLVGTDDSAEEILQKHTGLTQSDINTMHLRLVEMILNPRQTTANDPPTTQVHAIESSDSDAQADTVVCLVPQIST
jgi:hypothetical protein